MIYLESPACVGFSYDDTGDCTSGDPDVATQNYLAMQDFFNKVNDGTLIVCNCLICFYKFPDYRTRDFYITGESYGGIYIPMLANEIIQGNDSYPMALKGYAIGNGCFDHPTNSVGKMFYYYYHALFGDE